MVSTVETPRITLNCNSDFFVLICVFPEQETGRVNLINIDHINRMITLSVITLNCNSDFFVFPEQEAGRVRSCQSGPGPDQREVRWASISEVSKVW